MNIKSSLSNMFDRISLAGSRPPEGFVPADNLRKYPYDFSNRTFSHMTGVVEKVSRDEQGNRHYSIRTDIGHRNRYDLSERDAARLSIASYFSSFGEGALNVGDTIDGYRKTAEFMGSLVTDLKWTNINARAPNSP